MAAWPERFPPEPMSVRRRLRMDAGRAYEAHVVGRMMARRAAGDARS